MRSVFVHLREAAEEDVARFLQCKYPFQKGPPWICDVAGDPCLYIDFYRDGRQELEPQDWTGLARALGREPATSVVAEISGRRAGNDQVSLFVVTMLGHFEGVAQDDYTDYWWTAAEVVAGIRVQGKKFFEPADLGL